MGLPKLFKRAINGKILQWEIEIEGACFWTISGYTDGIKTQSQPTICSGKNQGKKNSTTPEQQALAEAKAMFRKRKEMGSFESINDIDNPVYFKPMLAHDFNDYKDKLKFPLFSQPKLDGIRCVVKSDGMWSRNGKPIISAPHIFEAIKPLFEVNPDLIFDGELYANKDVADFYTIVSCVRKTKPTLTDLETSKKIQYWIYDMPSVSGGFSKRENELIEMELPECCVKVQSVCCINENAVKHHYEYYMEQGYEGQMIRTDSEYENKRSKSLLKHKLFVDDEFEILGVEEGKGNLSGKVGRLNFKINGKPFDAAVNGDWEYIERLWKSKDGLIGKMATVKYFELTEDGIPRFPKIIAIRDFE